MDQSVLDAIERWPNVPAVFGWLSLSQRGQWRLHPNGTANQGGAGETIHNQQILSFIDRNYAHDERDQWFFQNGPQRVYVRLDAAPLIASVTGQPTRLQTHNQLPIMHIERWVIDPQGQLYFHCEHGSAMICDKDLELVAGSLLTDTGIDLLDWWMHEQEHTKAHTTVRFKSQSDFAASSVKQHSAPLEFLPDGLSMAQHLGFITTPRFL